MRRHRFTISRIIEGAFEGFIESVVLLPFSLLKGWALMIALGIAHAEMKIPPVSPGFWTSFILVVMFELAFHNTDID